MLFHEITPFATAHRDALETVIYRLELRPIQGALTLHRETVEDMVKKLKNTKRAFDRFEACALDEWKTKERLEKKLMEAGLYYNR